MSADPAGNAHRGRLCRVAQALLPLLLLAAALGLAFSRGRSAATILALCRHWAEVGALACGMTAVIVSGGLDLSIGAVVVLSAAVLNVTWQHLGWPIGLACAAAVTTGAAAGSLNGFPVSLGIAPPLVTLATMATFTGLALTLSNGEPIAAAPAPFTALGNGDLLGVPGPLWLLLASALTWGLLLHAARFGRSLYAIGDNRTAAELAALPVRRRLRRLYALNGLVAGLVAVSLTSRTSATGLSAEPGLELHVIAAVVLGGTRISGGAGSILRTLLGTAIVASLQIGLGWPGNAALRLPGSLLVMVQTDDGRLVVVAVLMVIVAVLNERLANARLGDTPPLM